MKFSLPSIQQLANRAVETFKKYPLSIISAIISATAGIWLTETIDSSKDTFPLINLMLTAALGIPTFFCASIIIRRNALGGLLKYGIYIAVTLILILVYFTLPDKDSTLNTYQPYIRYALYNAIAHLLVSIAPYVNHKELNGFWNYNKALFLRILTALLYSFVLYSGLALALVAIELLFDLQIHEELYMDLFIVILGIFNTWVFLSGIPEDFEALEANHSYPKGLKIFAQYILLSLLGVYLIILYAYGIKIILGWDWPQGIVSYMIMIVAVAGILTMLLIHPYAKSEENRWIGVAQRGYYILLFPLLFLLFVAIGMRIGDYGITVNRYLILMVGCWLVINAVYILLKPANIRFIPMSLAIVLFLISFGPWGIFNISKTSQTNRLENILTDNDILITGKISNEVAWATDSLPDFYSEIIETNEGELSDSIHNEVHSITNYLGEYHGFGSIRDWFEQDIHGLILQAEQIRGDSNKWFYLHEPSLYMRTMGLRPGMKYDRYYESYYYNNKQIIDIENYAQLVILPDFYFGPEMHVLSNETQRIVDDRSITFHFDTEKSDTIRIEIDNSVLLFDVTEKKKAWFSAARNQYEELDNASYLLTVNSTDGEAKLYIQNISIEAHEGRIEIQNMSVKLLLK